MLNQIIALSLRNRAVVLVAALAVAVYGTLVGSGLPIDVLPDLDRPRVTILTEAHGLAPTTVEQLITRQIERSVSGATGVVRVRSSSMMGLSTVTVEFGWDRDIYQSRQIVQEKLQLARGQLPPGVVPQMAPIASLMGQILLVAVRSTSGKTDITDVRAFADQSIRLRLMSVPGVAQVVSTGGAPRQLQVLLEADQLRAHGVDLPAVARALRDANISGSGGVFQAGSKGPWVNVTGLLQGASQLEQVVVRNDPIRPILVRDLGRVEFGPAAIRTGDAGVDGRPAVILVVFKQPGVDTLDLTRRIDQELDAIDASLPQDLQILRSIYRQSEFIQRAIDNVSEAVILGAILVALVLFLFLFNFRTTCITLTAIPLSVAVTAVVFQWLGVSINTMTLGGLAVAIGALVDDAIVDVENVFRRLRQHRSKGGPLGEVLAVVFMASSEVRKPILIGTVVVTAVYVPLFALSGMEGRLFTPIGIAYIVSILASLLVSLTLTPVLCYFLLPESAAMRRTADTWFVRRLKAAAVPLIQVSMRIPVAIVTVLAGLVLVGMVILLSRGSEFLPEFNEGAAQVNLVLPAGTSLETADRYGQELEQVVLAVNGVLTVGRRTGRAEEDAHVMDVNVNEMIVSFDPASRRSRADMLREIRARVRNRFPGVATETEQPLAHLISHLLSGVTAQVGIKVQGPDLAVLRRLAQQVRAAVAGIPGVTDLLVEQQHLVEQVEVRPDRQMLARLGLKVRAVAETVELALEGEEISRFIQGEFSFPIVMRLVADDRKDLQSLRSLPLPTLSRPVRLGDVATVELSRTPNQVSREDAIRTIIVQHNVEDRSLGAVAADVDRAIAPLREQLPPGYTMRISGQFEAQEAATRRILLLSLISLAVMGMVLYSHFRSHNLVLQTLLNIPTAFVGAVALILLTGQNISVATLVGLISLGGIAARNKILLLDHYLHLMAEEEERFTKEMIVRAGQERIVPVLMTALTSGIALLPLLLWPDHPGRELLYPVATVIVGGLISTTLLDLLLSPGVFWLFGRSAAEQAIHGAWSGRSAVEQVAGGLR